MDKHPQFKNILTQDNNFQFIKGPAQQSTMESQLNSKEMSFICSSEHEMKFQRLPQIKPNLNFNQYSSRSVNPQKRISRSLPIFQYAQTTKMKSKIHQRSDQIKEFKLRDTNMDQGMISNQNSSSYNNSLQQSGLTFSFPRKDRMKVPSTYQVGPCSYDIKKKDSIFHTFKKDDLKYNILKSQKKFQESNSPCPNSYSYIIQLTNSSHSLWSKSKVDQREKKPSMVPGPGAYTLENLLKIKKRKALKKIPSNPDLLKKEKKLTCLPGPGSYNLGSIIHNDRFMFARSQRKNEFLFNSLIALQTPGPSYLVSPKKKTGGTFSTAKKPELFKIIDTPAAGNYDSFSDFNKRERHVFKKSIIFNQKILANMTIDFDGLSQQEKSESDI